MQIESLGVFRIGYLSDGELLHVVLIRAQADHTEVYDAQNAVDGIKKVLDERGLGDVEVDG